jgi:chorismate mutase/prephenate dehydratase
MNKLDRQIVKLVQDRAKTYQKWLASAGVENHGWDSSWEADQLTMAVSRSKGPLNEEALRSIIRELVSACRCLDRPRRICFLGPAYSYSHLAAVRKFGESTSMVPVGTIKAVFEEVNSGTCDFGLVPIENSTDGRIVDTLDMLSRLPVKICGEVQLRIHHNLLARCERRDVTEVFSKPQALSQCRDWLSQHLPDAQLVAMTSTAKAAQLAAEKKGAAAIASAQAASRYGLQILAASIEDNADNVTRFAVIGDAVQKRTGQDKTSVMFEISHQPGSLADIMNIFKRCSLNLTWIESFPMPGTKNEYLFFVECQGHTTEVKVKRALTALEKKAVRLEILGSYPRAEPEDT